MTMIKPSGRGRHHDWRCPLRFRHLHPTEIAAICNGCGAKGGRMNPPDFLFQASCDHYDFNYWLGGTEASRLKADLQFYAAMKRDVGRISWWRKPLASVIAWFYFRAVRRFGRSAFCYGKLKTWTDLRKEVHLPPM